MLLFIQIFVSMFAAEMGDKTQFLTLAMASRYRMRDVIGGVFCAVLTLNLIAVLLGACLSEIIPMWIVRFAAALAFFWFALDLLGDKSIGSDEKESSHKTAVCPSLSVFLTFFVAELGDKTQLTAVAFAANQGLADAVIVWLACCAGLFLADIAGLVALHFLGGAGLDAAVLTKLAFIIFALFGILSVKEGTSLILGENGSVCLPVIASLLAAGIFAAVCFVCLRHAARDSAGRVC